MYGHAASLLTLCSCEQGYVSAVIDGAQLCAKCALKEIQMNTSKYPDVHVRLTGTDGNAFAIMGTVARALREAGVPKEEIDEYREESMSGDYDNLLRTAMRWVNVS